MTPDKKARIIVILNTITLIGGAITLFLLIRIIIDVAQANAETNQNIITSQKVTEKELGCIASFFSKADRQTIYISNLEKCQIIHTDTGKTEQLALTPAPTSPSPSVSASKKQTSTPSQVQGQDKQHIQNTPLLSEAQPRGQDDKFRIINFCVPIVNICIRL